MAAGVPASARGAGTTPGRALTLERVDVEVRYTGEGRADVTVDSRVAPLPAEQATGRLTLEYAILVGNTRVESLGVSPMPDGLAPVRPPRLERRADEPGRVTAVVTCASASRSSPRRASAGDSARAESSADALRLAEPACAYRLSYRVVWTEGSEARVPLPWLNVSASGDVTLRVVMPPGVTPGIDQFPRMRGWQREGESWTATAPLPATPAFVRVVAAGRSKGGRGRFLDAVLLVAAAAAIAVSLKPPRLGRGRGQLRTEDSGLRTQD